MGAVATRLTFPARWIVVSLLLSTLVVLADWGGMNEPRGNALVRVVPMAPLTDAERETGIAGVERAFSRLRIRAGEELPVDSALMSALASAVESMPDTLQPEGVQHVERMLQKCWPAPAARQLGSLLMRYRAFRQAEKRLLYARQAATVDAEDSRLAAWRTLQLQYFDPATAQGLFGEHNALAMYSQQLRRLDEDFTRAEPEKAAARAMLQRQYEIEVQAVRGRSMQQ